MRQKMENLYFTFLYPGRQSGQGKPPKSTPQIAIPRSGEWVAIEGDSPHREERSAAVFYSPQSLRELARALDEAADLLEEYRGGNQKRG